MEFLGSHPGRRVLTYFAAAILVGSAVLCLPVCSAGDPVSPIDAFFTATSAVCVTGLIVLDTGSDWSLFGQIVILTLIQLGGLGIMTMASGLLLMIGSRPSFANRLGISQSLGSLRSPDSATLVKAVVGTALTIELIGALALLAAFQSDMPLGEAAYCAVFHSVSAFCNAGFSTFPDSLERFASRPYVVLVFAVLIVLGGIGFVVIREVLDRIQGRTRRMSLHSHLCISATLILLFGGATAFYLFESGGALSHLGPVDRVCSALFQSVTTRTAGFNTFPQQSLTEVSILLTLILMFIGACPGSTGGGIKTTTMAAILLRGWHRFRGRQSVPIFRRSISEDSVQRALSLFLLAVIAITALFAALMFSQSRGEPHTLSHGWFVDHAFEAVSSFGTVGLSLGVTPELTVMGKLITIVSMFTGRVGLLTLAFGLARPPKRGELVHADEQIMVG